MALNPFDAAIEDLDREEAPQQPPPANPFDTTLKAMDDERETQLKGALTVAQETTPDKRAEAVRIGQRLGLPVDVVERNFEAMRKRAKIVETPYAQMMRETPTLATWLEQPDHAAVAHDDLEQLGALEWLVTAPQRAFSQGINQVRFAQLKTESMFRTLTREEQDLLGSYRHHMDLGGELGAGGAWWKQAITGAGALLPNIAGGAAMALKYGTAGALATGIVGAAGGSVLPGYGTVAGAGSGALLGFRSGGLYGAGKFGFQLEAGLALNEYERYEEYPGGPRLEPDVARAAALATGLMNAGLEAYGLTALAKSIPGVNKLTGAGLRAGVKEALKQPSVRAGLAAAMRNYGGTLTAETATEVAQRAATILSGELAKSASGQAIAHRGGADIFEDLINEGVGAIQSFGLTVLPGPTLQLAQARAAAQAAQGNVEFFRSMGEGMAASKAAQRAPGAVQQLVERAVAAGPVPNVYAPVQTWVTYWQEKGQDPAAMAAEVTGDPRALEHAEQQGGLLKIPTAAYAVKLAPTEHNEFFASELKMAPDEMNTREALEFQEAEVARAEAEQQQAEQQAQAALTPTQQVEQQLRERFTAAEIPESTAAPLAQFVSAAVGKLTTDAGFDPAEVFSGYGFTIARPTSTDAAAAAVTPAGSEPAVTGPEPDATAPYAVQDLPLSTVQATAGQPGAPAAPASAVLDPDAPIAAMGDISGAALRMMAEDPDIVRKAEAMRTGASRRRASEPRSSVDLATRALQTSQSEVGTDADRLETGDGRPDDRAELTPPDVGGGEQGTGDRAGAQRRRLPTAIEIAGSEGAAIFAKAEPEADRARLTPDVTRELERIADELNAFQFVEKTWAWLGEGEVKTGNAAGGEANIVGGAAGAPVYNDILNYAPLNASGKKGAKAAGKAAKTTEQGRPEVEAAVRKLLATGVIHNNIAEGAVRVAERRAIDDYRDLSRPMLPPSWGVEATPALVEEVFEAVDAALEDAADEFNPSEFEQGLFDLADQVDNTRLAAELNAKTWLHGTGANVTGDLRPPIFLTTSRQGAEWFVTNRGAEGEGSILPFKVSVSNPLTLNSYEDAVVLRDILQGAGIKVVLNGDSAGWTWAVPAVGEAGPYEGSNPIDVVYLPAARAAIMAAGYDAVYTKADPIENTEVEALVTLAAPITPVVDTLDTGEQQPRLPGAEGVRDQNVAMPEVAEVPFALQPEERRRKKGKQTELFQSAWHGSPHVFEQFSLHAIGSGEGAQSYGWGLYFASKREVAERYRTALAAAKPIIKIGGVEVDPSGEVATSSLLNAMLSGGKQSTESIVYARLRAKYANARGELTSGQVVQAVQSEIQNSIELEQGRKGTIYESLLAQRRVLESMTDKGIEIEAGGRLFKVELPDDDVMLDWDKPASQQPPKVQAALMALGVTWDPFVPKSPAMFLRWFDGKEATRLWNEDIGIREALHQAYHFARQGDVASLNRWQEQHQGLTGRRSLLGDPLGERIYQQLAQTEANALPGAGGDTWKEGPRLASSKLAQAGIVGIRYLDGFSRAKGEGSANYVIFDDKLVQVQEFFQPAPERTLLAHHNLTAANLLHMAKMGGLAVPSLAITRSDQTITGFGEITLLGSTALGDPQAGMQVFGADIYSPRYPTIHYKIPAEGEKKLGAIVATHKAITGQSYIDLDSLQKEGARYVRQIGAVLVEFLAERGIPRPAPVKDKGKYATPGQVDQFLTRYALEAAVQKAGLEAEFDEYAEKLFASLKPTEQIFRGFTNMGNRSYKPHTLENVVAIVKKELRGGESGGNLYGMGQLRARFTPRFRSVEAIRKAKGKLVTKEAFETVKEELEAEFFGLVNALKSSYEHDAETFRFTDTVLAVMEDTPRIGLTRALKDYGFIDVDTDVQTEIGDFLSKLRTLPTEYFEAKALRVVGLEEFAGAVVPDTASTEVLALLADAGIVAATYTKGDNVDRRRAVSALAAQLGEKVLFQDDKGSKRGSIVFGPDRSVTVNLFEKADLSTFLHESGHFFLELYGDLVDKVNALPLEGRTPTQQRLLTDYAALLRELGVAGRQDIGREQHERFARMFETYLGEGRAPTLELQEVFSKFRAWILGVYRSLRALNANLTPEVRAVFDRMLATDAQIAAAEARGRFEAIFTTPEMAGMSPAEFDLYRQTVEDASRTAREQLDAKLQGEVRREQTAAWKAERTTIRDGVAALAHQAPIYQALAAMRRGTNADGSPLLEGMDVPPLKLSRQVLVDRYGEERVKRLPKPFVYTRDGGVDPELVADRFGFSSGDELVLAIETTEPMEQAIDRETDRQMIERHGAMLLDGTVADAAQLAAANDVRDLVLRAELRALWKLANKVRPFVQQARREGQQAVTAERAERAYERRWFEAEAKLKVAQAKGAAQAEIDALEQEVSELRARARGGAATVRAGLPSAVTIQQTAQMRIARTRVQDLNPAVFWSASRQAATKALEHAARQEFDEAITAKTLELLNVALYREAERAREDVAVRVAKARDLGNPKSRARIGLAGGTFLEQIDGILDRYNFAKATEKQLAKRARMRDWLEAMEADGLPVDDLPAEVLDDLRRVDYQTVPYAELVGITDGLAQIVHFARLKNRLLKNKAGRDFAETRDALVTSIRDLNVARKHPLEFDKAEDRKHKIARAYAAHIKIATFARMMDGGKDGGAMWETVIRPVNAAADAEQTRRSEEGRLMAALLEAHYPGRGLGSLKEKVFIPAIGGSLSKEARIAVVLTRGNEDGLARLLADPTRRWTEAGVEAIAATLDGNDLAFINAMWAHLDRFWPEIAAKQERVTGLAPEKVAAKPFTVNGVAMTGGYYPLMYDERLSARASRNAAVSEAKLASAAAYVSATTRRGHVKARVSNVKLSVRLDLGVAFQHADQVIHDLTHHEMLIDVTRILRDQKVADAIYATRGPAVYRQFTQALSAIAVGTSPETDLDKAATFMRTGAQVAGLGYNLWTGAQQPLGLFNGMERVGAKWVLRGMRRWLSDAATMQSTLAWIVERSPFMAERSNTGTQDIMQLRQQLGKAGGWFDNLVRTVTLDTLTQQHLLDSFLWHIGVMQRVADVPTWLGAYEKAMADPANGANEDRAVALADQAVIDSQGSGHIKDLADVQRGSGLAKLWLTFYSYGSTTINRAAAIADRGAKTPNAITTMLGHYLLLYVVPAAATIALANAVGKRDDDEPEGWFGAIAAESLGSALNGVVLVRELSGVLTDGTRGYVGPAGARLLETLSRAIQQVKQGEADEALLKAVNAAAGVIFRYPAGQVQRTVDGFVALQEGRTHNPAALLFGPPPKEVAR